MTKSPDAFRTISEVAEALDVPAHVLRFWETRFSQVKPVKRGGGRRYYRPDDVRLLRGIRGLLYDDGMTIKGVQKILREQGVRHVIALGTVDDTSQPDRPKPRPVAKPPAEAEPTRKQPAPRSGVAEPVAASANGSTDRHDGGSGLGTELGDAAQALEKLGKPLDRPALRRLVGELEALRSEMVKGA